MHTLLRTILARAVSGILGNLPIPKLDNLSMLGMGLGWFALILQQIVFGVLGHEEHAPSRVVEAHSTTLGQFINRMKTGASRAPDRHQILWTAIPILVPRRHIDR